MTEIIKSLTALSNFSSTSCSLSPLDDLRSNWSQYRANCEGVCGVVWAVVGAVVGAWGWIGRIAYQQWSLGMLFRRLWDVDKYSTSLQHTAAISQHTHAHTPPHTHTHTLTLLRASWNALCPPNTCDSIRWNLSCVESTELINSITPGSAPRLYSDALPVTWHHMIQYKGLLNFRGNRTFATQVMASQS